MRILFITANRLGDAIMSTGLLNYFAKLHPKAAITIASGPIPAPLFTSAPGLEQCIIFEKKPFSLHWFKLWRRVVSTRWDIVVDLRRSLLRYFIFNKNYYRIPKPDEHCHRVRFLGRVVGLEDKPPEPTIWLEAKERSQAAKIIPSCKPTIALAPAANWQGKQWHPENFANLADRLIKNNGLLPGASIAVLASSEERRQAEPILKILPSHQRIDLIGKTNLLTLAACLEKCSLFVGNDSGLMHMAAAVGVPTLGLFGPSRETLYSPWGKHCSWVRTPESFEELTGDPGYNHLTTDSLMNGLQVQVVEDALYALWDQVKATQNG